MKPHTVGRATGQSPIPHPLPPLATEVGFTPGTVVLTQDGEMPVEFLSPGDRVITRDAGMVRLVRISRTQFRVRAISFAAGSLGHTRPDQDLVLPAGQQVLIRDWRAKAMFGHKQSLERADTLVDGEFICDLGFRTMQLYNLHFDQPHVVYAGGLEVISAPVSAAEFKSVA